MRFRHKTEAKMENGLTIAERDRIDMIVSGMSLEYQKRVLMNINPDLLVNECDRRLQSYLESLDNIEKVYLKYRNKPLYIVTARENIKAYQEAIKNIKK